MIRRRLVPAGSIYIIDVYTEGEAENAHARIRLEHIWSSLPKSPHPGGFACFELRKLMFLLCSEKALGPTLNLRVKGLGFRVNLKPSNGFEGVSVQSCRETLNPKPYRDPIKPTFVGSSVFWIFVYECMGVNRLFGGKVNPKPSALNPGAACRVFKTTRRRWIDVAV